MDLLAALLSTADDNHLSRGERKALRALIADASLDDRRRASLRRDLTAAVRDRMRDPRDRQLVDWLADALGQLEPRGEPAAEARAWFGPEEPLGEVLVTTLASARRSIDAAVFTITDDRVSDTLLARHAAGVRVRVITDDDKSLDRGSDARRLARQGIPVAMDRSPAHFHHKFVVVDGVRLLNGSYNWTRSAARSNRENYLLTTDRRLVGRYLTAFERMWAELYEG